MKIRQAAVRLNVKPAELLAKLTTAKIELWGVKPENMPITDDMLPILGITAEQLAEWEAAIPDAPAPVIAPDAPATTDIPAATATVCVHMPDDYTCSDRRTQCNFPDFIAKDCQFAN